MAEEKKKVGRPKGTTKWTDEERKILHSCHNIYKWTKEMLPRSIEEIKITKRNISNMKKGIYKMPDSKERLQSLIELDSAYKNCGKAISYKMSRRNSKMEWIRKISDLGNEINELKRIPIITSDPDNKDEYKEQVKIKKKKEEELSAEIDKLKEDLKSIGVSWGEIIRIMNKGL